MSVSFNWSALYISLYACLILLILYINTKIIFFYLFEDKRPDKPFDIMILIIDILTLMIS